MSEFLWAKSQLETKNTNLVFILDVTLDKDCSARFNITANAMYKLYIDGKLRMYGPARAAKGYCRMDKKSVKLKAGVHRIAAVASAYNVPAFNFMKDTPYFYCKLRTDGKDYTTQDFKCYDFSVRVKNVQRYSYQRGFAEIFEQLADLTEYFSTPSMFGEELETVEVKEPKILSRGVPYPHFYTVKSSSPSECGRVVVDESLPLWDDRSITQIGNLYYGYYKNELKECISDTASQFKYTKGEKKEVISEKEYALFDLSRNVSGFIGAHIEALEDSEVYVIFDELLDDGGAVNFKRSTCCNIVKWTLRKGVYSLQTIEPYTLRYAEVVVKSGSIRINNFHVVPVENNDAFRLKFKIADKKLEKILKAAANTVAQNSSDLLMDCPSRERAGWINDVYYSRHSATTFTGSFDVLRNTLENYAVAEQISELPKNMIGKCYPADCVNGVYIPNCAFWYVIVMCEYILNSGDKRLKRLAKSQIFGIVDFFKKYENSDGLLENLESWVFVEWSQANDKDFITGVNYPSNMMYYKMLTSIDKLWHTERLAKKCERVKKNILKQSYNGEFFEDNRVRENGKLKSQNHVSEACQYHAFFSDIATKDTHPALYEKLSDIFVPTRNKAAVYPSIDKANVITGLLMRETMFLEYGEVEKALAETAATYGFMADKTMTLWEHVDISLWGSCNHGIAAYAGYVIITALTGFRGFYQDEAQFADKYAGIDCEFLLPWKKSGIKVAVKDGVRTIEKI